MSEPKLAGRHSMGSATDIGSLACAAGPARMYDGSALWPGLRLETCQESRSWPGWVPAGLSGCLEAAACLAAHVVLRAGPNRADRPRAALGRGRDGGQGSRADKGAQGSRDEARSSRRSSAARIAATGSRAEGQSLMTTIKWSWWTTRLGLEDTNIYRLRTLKSS